MEQSCTITLGRIKNKYIIIEIFALATESDVLFEAERLLWQTNKSSRRFMPVNRSWYMNNSSYFKIMIKLTSLSKILQSRDQAYFLQETLESSGLSHYTNLTLLYRGSENGWDPKTFHEICDGKGATFCLFLSSKGYLSGGFTSVPWTSNKD